MNSFSKETVMAKFRSIGEEDLSIHLGFASIWKQIIDKCFHVDFSDHPELMLVKLKILLKLTEIVPSREANLQRTEWHYLSRPNQYAALRAALPFWQYKILVLVLCLGPCHLLKMATASKHWLNGFGLLLPARNFLEKHSELKRQGLSLDSECI